MAQRPLVRSRRDSKTRPWNVVDVDRVREARQARFYGLRVDEEDLSLEDAARRLKKRWGISANADGLEALLTYGLGPKSGIRWYPNERPVVAACDLDRWAEYQLYRGSNAHPYFDFAPGDINPALPQMLQIDMSGPEPDHLADEMRANGWQVHRAADCLDSLSILDMASFDVVASFIEREEVEPAMLMLHMLNGTGTPLIALLPWDRPWLRSHFESRCYLFDSLSAFEAAVNLTIAGQKTPVRLAERASIHDDFEEGAGGDMQWLKDLASKD